MNDLVAPTPPQSSAEKKQADAHSAIPPAPDKQRSLDAQLEQAAAELAYPHPPSPIKKSGFQKLVKPTPPPKPPSPPATNPSPQSVPPALVQNRPSPTPTPSSTPQTAQSVAAPPVSPPSQPAQPSTNSQPSPPPSPPQPQAPPPTSGSDENHALPPKPEPPTLSPQLRREIQETPAVPKKPKKEKSGPPLKPVLIGMASVLVVGGGITAAVIAFTQNPTRSISPTAPESRPQATSAPATPAPTPAAAFCGNGKTEAAEECDDGNIVNGDGCSAGCKTETASVAPPPATNSANQPQKPLGPQKPTTDPSPSPTASSSAQTP